MTAARMAIAVLVVMCAANAFGQTVSREPHIGYVSPAGGKQGSTFQILVGGQLLRGATDVYISGSGVHASIVRYFQPVRNFTPEQRTLLSRRLRDLFEERWSDLAKNGSVSPTPPWDQLAGLGINRRAGRRASENPTTDEVVELPDIPLLYDLDKKNLRELLHVVSELRGRRMGQMNAAIAESVLIEVTINHGAAAGDREMRLRTGQGLTNPLMFQVGGLPEVRKLKAPDGPIPRMLPKEPPLNPPVLVNGQIMPGDVDRLNFRARKGQHLVIEAQARRLIPFLADAVPGWFQATLALYNPAGNRVAFVDDYQFSPDPILLYEVPEDGEYSVEIRDSIYRGRDDFVYRLSIGERPFITSVFPLGCKLGLDRFVSLDGWNLSAKRLFLDAPKDGDVGVRQKRYGRRDTVSDPVTYEVDALPASNEVEPNDTLETAQRARRPRIMDGRIGQPGDVDFFKFKGKKGEEIVVGVMARKLYSPMDSLVRLYGPDGTVIAWNDDSERKEGDLYLDLGMLTHHADSYLRTKLPASGDYVVQVSDAQAHGGDAFAYRLRISPPQPDFELCVTPSSLNVRGGFATPLHVYARRKDGFAGEIAVTLKDAPPGLALTGAKIPAGRDSVRMTLEAPPDMDEPVALLLEGSATIGHKVVKHPVVPADEMMQAFLYRHLTPAQELLVAVSGGRRVGRHLRVASKDPVRIPLGGTVQVRISAPPNPRMKEVKLELDQPPPGISVQSVNVVPGGLSMELKADSTKAAAGLADNLIVEAFFETERGGQGGKAAQKQRVSIGYLPAIPCQIVTK
jgi:hypothetical protein